MRCSKCGREAMPGERMACHAMGSALFCLPSCELAATKHVQAPYDMTISDLTKREYFAGLILQGLLAGGENKFVKSDDLVKSSRFYADALLAELEKKK